MMHKSLKDNMTEFTENSIGFFQAFLELVVSFVIVKSNYIYEYKRTVNDSVSFLRRTRMMKKNLKVRS